MCKNHSFSSFFDKIITVKVICLFSVPILKSLLTSPNWHPKVQNALEFCKINYFPLYLESSEGQGKARRIFFFTQ